MFISLVLVLSVLSGGVSSCCVLVRGCVLLVIVMCGLIASM